MDSSLGPGTIRFLTRSEMSPSVGCSSTDNCWMITCGARVIASAEFRPAAEKEERMAGKTRYRVMYLDENDKEVYNDDFQRDSLASCLSAAHVKRTKVWMTHPISSTPES